MTSAPSHAPADASPRGLPARVGRAIRWRLDKWPYRWRLRSTARLRLPDFLGIGAQKAGTTWLYENLACHPDLFLAPEKELHYFDWAFHEPLASYARHFAAAGDRVAGEITPGYSILPPARIHFIRRVMPDARLILLLRDPIERAWSHAVKNLATLTGRPVASVDEREFIAHFEHARFLRRGDYPAMLRNWLAAFPAEQLHVDFYDHVAAAPRALLTSIFEFLGVATDVDWARFPCDAVVLPRYEGDRVKRGELADRTVSAGSPMPPACRAFLETLYAADLEQLAARYGDPVTRWGKGPSA